MTNNVFDCQAAGLNYEQVGDSSYPGNRMKPMRQIMSLHQQMHGKNLVNLDISLFFLGITALQTLQEINLSSFD
jgi:hypothetical protein